MTTPMGKQLSQLVKLLPKWIINRWFASASSNTDDRWVTLPPAIAQALANKLNALPTPQPYRKSIHLTTREALRAWQADPETVSNCLVFLDSPVDDIVLIVKESLQDYLLDCEVDFVLSGYQRSPNVLAITGHLQRELNKEKEQAQQNSTAPMNQAELHEVRPLVIVIPSLEPCFLRCIQGWECIEYLYNRVTKSRDCFWIFGCNHWAWTFLDKVCQVSAYLERTSSLPRLSGEELSKWLHPLLSTEVNGANGPITLNIEADDDVYWEALAKLAHGSIRAAAHLWLQTIRIDADLLTSEGILASDQQTVDLMTVNPTLPSLFSLEPLDRYLLHALLMHGEMTRSHLALSMGEDERIIRSRVQVLRREGIIRQTGRRLTVHPAHYPKLYSELNNNNFLIGQA